MADQKTLLAAKQAASMQKVKLILDTAERESRALTDPEKAELTALEREIDQIAGRLERLETDAAMTAQIEKLGGGSSNTRTRASLGEQFLASDTWKWLKDTKQSRAGAWTSPASELQAATITEDPASGGDLLVPDYRPGIITPIPRPLVVADLLAPGTTTSNSLVYMKEESFVNAAKPVLEGGLKPESTLIFTQQTETAKKIAHWIPVTDEILEDVAQMRSYIDSRLRMGVQLAEDDQLLSGDGIAPNFLGLLNQPGLAAAVVRTDPETNADAVARQISAIATTANIPPDGVIMHPSNFLAVQLSKSTTGEYVNQAGPLGSVGRSTIWGLPIALTTAIPLGVALVGGFKLAAQLFRKGGIRVEASNSHADFFIKNLQAIRAEQRAILAVYRASAMGTVTGLN